MNPKTITTKDGTEIYYKDWGQGPVITFSHGWPLSSDAWDGQMFYLAQNGFRVIAHDRRGHGRSEQIYSGNDMDTYADDLAAVIEALDLKDATLVGHYWWRRGSPLYRTPWDKAGRQSCPDIRCTIHHG
jgi:non-heme chloroperoxidase